MRRALLFVVAAAAAVAAAGTQPHGWVQERTQLLQTVAELRAELRACREECGGVRAEADAALLCRRTKEEEEEEEGGGAKKEVVAEDDAAVSSADGLKGMFYRIAAGEGPPLEAARHAVLWLNLERRGDRRARMEDGPLGILAKSYADAAAEAGVAAVTRVAAVDGRTLSDVRMWFAVAADLREKLDFGGTRHTIAHDGRGKLLEFAPTVTRGAVGCALSHREAWKRIALGDAGVPPALPSRHFVVLEDDLTYVSPLMARLAASAARVADARKRRWDVVFLSYHGCHNSSGEAAASVAKLAAQHPAEGLLPLALDRCGDVWYAGLFTYMVNGAASARRLLSGWPMRAQIDKHVALMCQSRVLRCFRMPLRSCPTYTPLSEATLDSDVQRFLDVSAAGVPTAHGLSPAG